MHSIPAAKGSTLSITSPARAAHVRQRTGLSRLPPASRLYFMASARGEGTLGSFRQVARNDSTWQARLASSSLIAGFISMAFFLVLKILPHALGQNMDLFFGLFQFPAAFPGQGDPLFEKLDPLFQ